MNQAPSIPKPVRSPKRRLTALLKWTGLLALAIGLGFVAGRWDILGTYEGGGLLDMTLMGIGALMLIHLALAVHELGHLLAGLAQGFRFELYVVGLLGIAREPDRIKVYLNQNLGYYGGVAATSPVADHPENAAKFARILLAGPLASLLFAGLCLGVAVLLPSAYRVLPGIGGFASLGIFLATTLPSKTGMFFTDRKRYQRLTQPGPAREEELALLAIMGSYAQHQSYRHVSQADIQTLIDGEVPFYRFFGLFNALCSQLEMMGKVDPALEAAYEQASQGMPQAQVAAFAREIEAQRGRWARLGLN